MTRIARVELLDQLAGVGRDDHDLDTERWNPYPVDPKELDWS